MSDNHDSPRTDAFLKKPHVAYDRMWYDFTRELESENHDLRRERDDLREALQSISNDCAAAIEEAGDAAEVVGPILTKANVALSKPTS